jgi:integrase
MALTDVALKNAPEGAILRENGLEFRFYAKGEAGVRFVGRVRGSGARVAIKLGRYPSLRLAEARNLGEANRRLCDAGTDPRHARADRAADDQNLVGALLIEYLNAQVENRASTINDKRAILKGALGKLEKRPVKRITKADVARLLDSYASKPGARRKLFSYLNHFLGWCQDRDLVSENVCRQIRPPKPVKPRDRILNDDELAAVMNLQGSAWGTMLQFILLTGMRGIEVCKMRKEELDLRRAVWNVPRATMKQDKPHAVPLSGAAQKLIKTQMEKNGEDWGPYLFGVGSRGERPFNGRSNGIEEVRRLTETTGWAGHDCRRTSITIMQRLGIPREVRVRITGHAQPRDGASAYEHYDFKKETREGVEKLADELERIKQGKPVV